MVVEGGLYMNVTAERGPNPDRPGRMRLAVATCLAVALAALASVVVVDPGSQRRIRVGSYSLRVPKGTAFERTDTGEYRLLLDQKTDQVVNTREVATVASRGLLGELSSTGMLWKVVGTGWFPKDTRVCLAGKPSPHRGGLETWVVQYYRQTYYDGSGLAYRYRHGVLIVRNRANGGGLVMDVSRMDDPATGFAIDWEPVRARLRTLLQNTEPHSDQPRSAWAKSMRRLHAWKASLLRHSKGAATPSPLDALPPRSVPVCLGPYELDRGTLKDQPFYSREDYERYGGYQLSFPGGYVARVAYRAAPFRGKDLVGFEVLRPAAEFGWFSGDDCVRGLSAPVPFHNQRGARQSYERLSKSQRYVGVMAMVATQTNGSLIFDISAPQSVEEAVDWKRLEDYLQRLRFAVIIGDFTAPDQGGERDHGLDFWPCPNDSEAQ
jgi:hypothetical protein